MSEPKLYMKGFCEKCGNVGKLQANELSKWVCDNCLADEEIESRKIEDRAFILQGTENILAGIVKGEFNALSLTTDAFSRSRKHEKTQFMDMIKHEIKWVTGRNIEIDEEIVIDHINHLVENILVNVSFSIENGIVTITVNRDE